MFITVDVDITDIAVDVDITVTDITVDVDITVTDITVDVVKLDEYRHRLRFSSSQCTELSRTQTCFLYFNYA